tara:strand:- start:137 stop:307 length:171 start_codon:yes stop_codon:yes gene_type:complete
MRSGGPRTEVDTWRCLLQIDSLSLNFAELDKRNPIKRRNEDENKKVRRTSKNMYNV